MSYRNVGVLVVLGGVAIAAPAAAASNLELDPPSLAFTATDIGFWSVPQTLTIRNVGSTDIQYSVGKASDFVSSLDSLDCAGNPCVLAAGASLAVTVAFAPHTVGSLSEQLVIEAGNSSAALPLSGTAFGPVLTIDQPAGFPAPLVLGDTPFGTTTAPGTIRIRNTGDETLLVGSARPVGTEDRAYLVTGPALPLFLDPNATAEWQIACRPVRVGSNSASFMIANNGGVTEFPVPLLCNGIGGAVAIDGGSVQLPVTPVGSASTAPLVLRNVGNLPVTISSVTTSDPQFTIASGGLPVTLPAGATATFEASFAPTQGGVQTSQLIVTSDAVLPTAGTLAGTGHTGHADVTPAVPDVGQVRLGRTGQIDVELGNHSDQALTLTAISIADPAVVEIDGNMLIGAVLQPDEELPITVRVSPMSPGAFDSEVSFLFDRGPAATMHVTATVTAPVLAVALGSGPSAALDFGDVSANGQSGAILPVATLSVTNTGDATLHISSCAIANEASADAKFNLLTKCSITLAPREWADLEISFKPITAGSHTATLQIESDASPMQLNVPLTGTGVMVPAAGMHDSAGCAATPDADRGSVIALLAVAGLAVRRRRRHAAATCRARVLAGAAVALAIAGCGAPSSDSPPVGLPPGGAPPGGSLVTVTLTGSGEGSVTSGPYNELVCPGECSALELGEVHFTAVAKSGSVFVGWDGPCAGTGLCVVVPSTTPTEVFARFEHQFHLVIGIETTSYAPFTAEASINGEICSLSSQGHAPPCTRDVLEGTPLTIDVFSPSSFTGWSGCPATPVTRSECTLTVTADTNVVAHFAGGGDKRTSIIPGIVATAVTTTNFGDDVVVAGVEGMAGGVALGNSVLLADYDFSLSDTQNWGLSLSTGPNPVVIGLDHDFAQEIYVLSHADEPGVPLGALFLHKVDQTGRMLWSVKIDDTSPVIAGDGFDTGQFTNKSLAAALDGDVVIMAQNDQGRFIQVYAGDGTIRWTHSTQATPLAVLVSHDGTITVPSSDSQKRGVVDRYDPSGTPITHYDLPALPATGSLALAYRACTLTHDDYTDDELLVCTSSDDLGGNLVIRAVDVATGVTSWQLDGLSPEFGSEMLLKPDASFSGGVAGVLTIDNQNAVRELAGPAVWDRFAPDHTTSPGGRIDAITAHDIVHDIYMLEVGAWTRACQAGESCGPDNTLTRGFIRELMAD